MNALIDTNVILDDILNRGPNIVTNDKGFLSDMYSSVSAISPANFLLKLSL